MKLKLIVKSDAPPKFHGIDFLWTSTVFVSLNWFHKIFGTIFILYSWFNIADVTLHSLLEDLLYARTPSTLWWPVRCITEASSICESYNLVVLMYLKELVGYDHLANHFSIHFNCNYPSLLLFNIAISFPVLLSDLSCHQEPHKILPTQHPQKCLIHFAQMCYPLCKYAKSIAMHIINFVLAIVQIVLCI